MRKQTKLVAVLSAAALLAIGASMTSFAAGWEKDEAGIWHYYDSDDEMVTGQWKKDGAKYFYLDDDGEMATDQWIEDEYYVGADGAMLVNQWIKTTSDEEIDDPDEDGEAWYYFGNKGKKITSESKKIAGKTYYFDTDGKMQDGWYEDEDGDVYYLGGEDEGWRTESQWLWLDTPDDEDEIAGHNDEEGDPCDEEGWYYFGSNGKMYQKAEKKKVNGKYYFFNEHGQMLYEWINNSKVKPGSNAQLDGSNDGASPSDMLYMNQVEEGWRADGWYEIDGSKDTDTDSDTDWYYFKDGEAKKASMKEPKNKVATDGDGKAIWREKIKIKASGNKYFCFDQYGRMKTGLQLLKDGFYYFDDNGYMKTGKVSNVEDDADSWTFYFNTKNGGNGKGWTGEKNGYLYWNGKRLEADDDYKIWKMDTGKWYLVNTSGKIQKSESKKYDIEGNTDDLYVLFNNDDSIKGIYTDKEHKNVYDNGAATVYIPRIELYDNIIVPKYATDVDAKSAKVVVTEDAGDEGSSEAVDTSSSKVRIGE